MDAPLHSDAEPQSAKSQPPRPFQFTLRYLLLAVLVVSVVLAIAMPVVRRLLSTKERFECNMNLYQIGAAMHSYHAVWGTLPPVITTDVDGKPMHSWRILIFPYLDVTTQRYDFSQPWNGPKNLKLAAHIFRCASDRRTKPNMTNYVAIYGPGTAWDVNKGIQFDEIIDGTSNTVLVVEIRDSDIHWMEPRDISFDDLKLTLNAKDGPSIGSYHVEGAIVAMADGSVRLLSPDEVETHLRAMLTIAGGERQRDPLDSQ
ncbi:MAG TPA: DUF1559 domain-containing protein [Pirellulaceae bacterium]|nr:DUF1559 domain-containing protein [Pirellulaceae bacterium]